MRILILGENTMVGHVVGMYFKEHNHQVAPYNSLWNVNELKEMLSGNSFNAVINCVAVVNQDAENDKVKAIEINSLLPHCLEKMTAETDTVVVHRSTDCIFSGIKGGYKLEDFPDGTSFYAKSKALGEIVNSKDITIRTSLVGPEIEKDGRGLFNWFYNQQGKIDGFANSIWTGLTTLEFAKGIEWMLNNKKHGIFQLVPETAISKYNLLLLFEKYYPGNRTISRINNAYVDKSLVPVTGGYKIPCYEEQIKEMRKWTDEHSTIYRYQ